MKVIQNLTQEQRAQLFQNGGGFVFGGGNGTTRTSGTGTRTSTSAGFTSGSILSKDASSITLKLSDGNTKIVYYSSSTTVSETKDTTADALTVGEDVVVRGSSNTDGSLTASSITVGTAETGMPGGAGAPPGGTGTPPGGTSGSTDAGATATTATTAK